MVRKTDDGYLVTTGTLKIASLAIALGATLVTGIVSAVRFIDRSTNAPTRMEFEAHVRLDSSIHSAFYDSVLKLEIHSAFQDSLIARQSRNTTGLVCQVFKNPRPFCTDAPTRFLP